jgi:hypothetical protein
MMEHLGVKTLFVHTNEYVDLFNKALKKYLPQLNTHFVSYTNVDDLGCDTC